MKTSGKTVLLLSLALGTAAVHAQTSSVVKDDLFAGTEKFAKNATDVEEITMDPDTLAKVGGRDESHGMMLNVVRTYSYAKPGMYNMADVDEYRNKVNTGEWHCSVHISHPLRNESTDVCQRRRTDNMRESATIVVEPKELTFIHKISRGYGSSSSSSSSSGNANSSWNVYPDARTFSNAEMHANMEVAMAEMHAQMAGMQASMHAQIAGSLEIPSTIELRQLNVPSSDQLRQLEKQLRDLQPDAAAKPQTPAKAPAQNPR